MLFAVLVGRMCVSLGPVLGAVITVLPGETLGISLGTRAARTENLVCDAPLVIFITFLPKGIPGTLDELARGRVPALHRVRAGSVWDRRTGPHTA
jgi:branched-chain amino acid transport system permease protein